MFQPLDIFATPAPAAPGAPVRHVRIEDRPRGLVDAVAQLPQAVSHAVTGQFKETNVGKTCFSAEDCARPCLPCEQQGYVKAPAIYGAARGMPQAAQAKPVPGPFLPGPTVDVDASPENEVAKFLLRHRLVDAGDLKDPWYKQVYTLLYDTESTKWKIGRILDKAILSKGSSFNRKITSREMDELEKLVDSVGSGKNAK